MSAFPHPNQIRKRISDTPLTVKLALLKGGPHGINASHPEEFNRALLAFLAG